jgi:hypothetical protein
MVKCLNLSPNKYETTTLPCWTARFVMQIRRQSLRPGKAGTKVRFLPNEMNLSTFSPLRRIVNTHKTLTKPTLPTRNVPPTTRMKS